MWKRSFKMRETLLKFLRCPSCLSNSLSLSIDGSNQTEIRSGEIVCNHCSNNYKIEDGIIDFLNNANANVLRERSAMDDDQYITDESGNKYKIRNETIEKFKDKLITLPEGDGSYLFKRGGSFQSTAEASDRFYSALSDLSLTGREKILEIGACFSYASFKFAKKGCSVVALDISNYLRVSDLFIKEAYFDRIFSDMHFMPFVDSTYDIVFGSAILHHSKNLKDAFKEIRRVLKPGGKLVLINEAARGVFEKIHPVFKQMEEKGFGDTSYAIPEWIKGAQEGGFKKIRIVFSSLADDYITRHKNRNSKPSFKIELAHFFQKNRKLESFVLFFTVLPRFLFRPKSWKLICYK